MQLGVVFVIKVIFVAQDKFDDTREVCLFFFFFFLHKGILFARTYPL